MLLNTDLVAGGAPFRSRDADRLGLRRRLLGQLVAAGVLARPLRSVYVDARVPDSRDLRIACLQLVIPLHAVIWGRTAAWLRGLDTFAPGERNLLSPECVVPHHAARMRDPDVRVVEGYLPQADLTMVGALLVTTARRTALDLARALSRPMALAALDAFAHARLVTVEDLVEGLGPLRGFPGIVQARQLVAMVQPLTESAGESWLRLRIIDAGFPWPRPQIELLDPSGRVVYRLDLGYDDLRLGLEYDGMQFHDAAEMRAHDERRRADCKRCWGWDVHGFAMGEVLGTHPGLELAIGEWLGREPVLPRRW